MTSTHRIEADQDGFAPKNEIRAAFSRAMSAMYRDEVPAYGELVDLVEDVNKQALAVDPLLKDQLDHTDGLARITEERHGAIRLGTAEELFTMRRLFAVMGMSPVGYYDLSVAGIPVHSTAFRPVEETDLNVNPFRVFCSLLRLELIEDEALRAEAAGVLAGRDIYTAKCRELIASAEEKGGLTPEEAEGFVREALETFRWHRDANVSAQLYQRLHDEHRLIADIVSFKGPHINHLTPRTLDIDAVQAGMPKRGIDPKAVIEGPPLRKCPILLRQTSFKALEEAVAFPSDAGSDEGTHTARFGEIEQRGVAVTRKGRELYDELLDKARAGVREGKGSYGELLKDSFASFPDSYEDLRAQDLAWFRYSLTEKGQKAAAEGQAVSSDIAALLQAGLVRFDPIIYEDFLPVSAAGIFRSNLGDGAQEVVYTTPNQESFEAALGASVQDEMALYSRLQQESIESCQQAFGGAVAAE
ncbi:2-oxoadipate dioxygenase/decarboxylase HglS [Kiloniella sp. b19]|uniref:2-oxoadipate dioxygenase/decarboxylase HglS n=1 Tax=Kiloniella sp. GXU_MW_B19 TaxID=3141326 RepID=UPI0031D5AC38